MKCRRHSDSGLKELVQPVPQTTAGDLLRQLSLLTASRPLQTFSLARLERDAESLRTLAPVEYFVLKGAISSARGLPRETREFYERALALCGTESGLILANYAVSMLTVGQVFEARALALRAFESSPGDLEVLGSALNTAVQIGAFALTRTLVTAARSYGKVVQRDAVRLQIAEALDARGVSEDEVISVVSVANAVARERGFLRARTAMSLSPESRDPTVAYTLLLEAEADELFEIELEIFDRLAKLAVPVEECGILTVTVGPDVKERDESVSYAS